MRPKVRRSFRGGFFHSTPANYRVRQSSDRSERTHTRNYLTRLSVASDSTCEYVRVNGNLGNADLRERIIEREDDYRSMVQMAQNYVSVQPWDATLIKAEWEVGRTGRSNGRSDRGADVACDDADLEDCEFWKAECKDIDCIYRGSHCRYQCAMAESDEEPKTKAGAPKAVLRLWRSAVKRA